MQIFRFLVRAADTKTRFSAFISMSREILEYFHLKPKKIVFI